MLRSKLSLALIALVFALTSCATGKAPKWVTSTPTDADNLYFVGMRTAAPTLEEGKRSAVAQAMSELVEHFEVEANVKFTERRTELETKVLDELNSVSDSVKVKGSMLDRWHFTKTPEGAYDVYVLLKYPRDEFLREKSRHLNERAQRAMLAQKALKAARTAADSGELTVAAASFIEALKIAEEADDAQLKGESLAALQELFSGIKISAASQTSIKAAPFDKFSPSPAVSVTIKRGASERPATNAPVLFTLSAPGMSATERALTDDKGVAYLKDLKVTTTGDATLKAGLDVEAFATKTLGSQAELLSSKTVSFDVQAATVKRNVRVIVLVSEDGSLKADTITTSAVSEALVAAGFDVLAPHETAAIRKTLDALVERASSATQDGQTSLADSEISTIADMLVTGSVSTSKGGANSGYTASRKADGFIKAVDLKTGAIVAQKNLSGVAGFGETDERAAIDALHRFGERIREMLLAALLKT